MNMKLVAIAVALFGLYGQSALANVVHLVNQSPKHDPIKVEYRIAKTNNEGQIIYSPVMHTTLVGQHDVPIDLGKHKYAGVLLVSANGYKVPGSFADFGKNESCSIATDKLHPEGTIRVVKDDNSLGCSHADGVIIR